MLATKSCFGRTWQVAITLKNVGLAHRKQYTFVPKKDNPPNIPKARPIEDFWAILKRMVYDKGWEAKNEQQLIGRITRKIREMDKSVCQNMIKKVPYILRKIEDNGPYSVV